MPKRELGISGDSISRVTQRVSLLIAILEGGGGCEPKPAINFQSVTFGKRVLPAAAGAETSNLCPDNTALTRRKTGWSAHWK